MFLQLPENVFCFSSFPFPDRFFLLFILPQPFSLLSLPEGSSGGSATLQRSSFLHLAFLQRKPPCSQNADGGGEQGGLGGYVLCPLVEELPSCSPSLPLPPPSPFPCNSSQCSHWRWCFWGGLASVVPYPMLSGQGESNLGCQVAREGKALPVSQLSDN